MNPTKAMLLQEMAMAPDLDTYFLAYKALENLNKLVAQTRANMVQQTYPAGQPSQPTTYGRFQQPAPGVYNPNMQPPQAPPQGPQPYSQSEPSWDEPSERMPWEEEG